jgi:ABC-2 type transport system permease protein
MSTTTYALRDSATMLRRDIRHSLRYPIMAISGLMVPVFLLLLFVGVFGNTLRAGLGAATPAGGRYIDYLAPGILVMTAGASAAATAINVCIDMNEGIIARFRTMAITRTSVLTGQVLSSLIRTLISGVLVVAVALGLGFRPTATPLEWLAAAGVFAMLTLALTGSRSPSASRPRPRPARTACR